MEYVGIVALAVNLALWWHLYRGMRASRRVVNQRTVATRTLTAGIANLARRVERLEASREDRAA